MIRFRSWFAHNKRVIKDAISKRTNRGARPDAPLMLGKILVDNNFDDNFERFAAIVGGDRAESFFVRALQYAATHDGINGTVRVSREHFGHVVLSRNWHVVSRKVGCSTYDALLSSGICVPISDGENEPADPFLSTPTSVDTSTPTGVDMSRLPVPVPVPVHLPPSPLAGGDGSPSASERPQPAPAEPDDVPGKPLRPHIRQRFVNTLECAIRCYGTLREQQVALELRQRLAANALSDDDIRSAFAGPLRWVTPGKLANFLSGRTAS